jgi:hypothetical protein
MTYVRLNMILTFSSAVLLVVTSVTSSDARPHANRASPTQNNSIYYNHNPSDNTSPIRDNSCFSSTGLPEMYACSSHGG